MNVLPLEIVREVVKVLAEERQSLCSLARVNQILNHEAEKFLYRNVNSSPYGFPLEGPRLQQFCMSVTGSPSRCASVTSISICLRGETLVRQLCATLPHLENLSSFRSYGVGSVPVEMSVVMGAVELCLPPKVTALQSALACGDRLWEVVARLPGLRHLAIGQWASGHEYTTTQCGLPYQIVPLLSSVTMAPQCLLALAPNLPLTRAIVAGSLPRPAARPLLEALSQSKAVITSISLPKVLYIDNELFDCLADCLPLLENLVIDAFHSNADELIEPARWGSSLARFHHIKQLHLSFWTRSSFEKGHRKPVIQSWLKRCPSLQTVSCEVFAVGGETDRITSERSLEPGDRIEAVDDWEWREEGF